MIEIPDPEDDRHEMWKELFRLNRRPPVPWTLIGAQMVALHGWAAGRQQIRPSRDADVLVNVRASANGTKKMSRALLDAGYDLELPSPEGIGHRFRKERVSIDILAPDGIGARASLETTAGARTVQVPGGTQALKRSINVAARSRTSRGTVPIPDLLGAILVKVRAIAVDGSPHAQERDVAFLLTLVDDPERFAVDMSNTERGWLRKYPAFADPEASCWDLLPGAAEGAIAYRRLAQSPD